MSIFVCSRTDLNFSSVKSNNEKMTFARLRDARHFRLLSYWSNKHTRAIKVTSSQKVDNLEMANDVED